MRLLPAAARVALPWKNGGGVTRELAVFPPGADFGSFLWRISLAEIRVAGAFSRFEGVDRHLAMVSGAVRLRVGDQPARLLAAGGEVLAFPGDLAASAEPVGGAAIDLNVMVRRGAWRATLTRQRCEADGTLRLPRALCFLVALQDTQVNSGGAEWPLRVLDALEIRPDEPTAPAATLAAAEIHVRESLECLLVTLAAVGPRN